MHQECQGSRKLMFCGPFDHRVGEGEVMIETERVDIGNPT